jgi:hypothetical protein
MTADESASETLNNVQQACHFKYIRIVTQIQAYLTNGQMKKKTK